VSYTIEKDHTITINTNNDNYEIIIMDDQYDTKARLHYTSKDVSDMKQNIKTILPDLYNQKALNSYELEKYPLPTFDLFGNGHKDFALYAGTHKTVDRFLLIRCKIPTKNWFFARYTGQFKIDEDANKTIYTCVMPETK
jgi:hypothetical protein